MLRKMSTFPRKGPDSEPVLHQLVHEFADIVCDRNFPCIYSRQPLVNDEIYFAMLPQSDTEKSAVRLLRQLCGIIGENPDAVGVLFAQTPPDQDLEDDLALAGRIVHAVMRANREDNPEAQFPQPDDPQWMLWLEDTGLFINFSSPAHRERRSRNVGRAFTVIAQARESFDRFGRSSDRSRSQIRNRISSYDSVPVHPALGRYGDPDTREALQYFLGDGTNSLDPTGSCPYE